MLDCLLIGDVEGAELNPVSDPCDDPFRGIDYLAGPACHSQLVSARPDEQHWPEYIGAVPDVNCVIEPQAFSIHEQFSDDTLVHPPCRQGPVLPGEVDINIRQDLDPIDPERFARTLPEAALIVPSSTRYLVPGPGYGSTCSIADLYHAVHDMGREPRQAR